MAEIGDQPIRNVEGGSREVDQARAQLARAQALLVNLAKDLAAKGEITLTKNRADEELVY